MATTTANISPNLKMKVAMDNIYHQDINHAFLIGIVDFKNPVYDAKGNLLSYETSGRTITTEYDSKNRAIYRTLFDGTNTVKCSISYDSKGRLADISLV